MLTSYWGNWFMIRARYLLTAENIATPTLKFDAQNRVLPSSVQALRTSSPCSLSHPVEPLTTFTPAFQAFR